MKRQVAPNSTISPLVKALCTFKSIGSIWAAEGKRTSHGADCIFCELAMASATGVENGTPR